MKTKEEVKSMIKEIEISNSHVLSGSMATIGENAPRALMQLSACAKLDALYWVIGKHRPKYEHEKTKKKAKK